MPDHAHDQAGAHDDGRVATHAPQPYSTFIGIWAALMLLTCVTVTASIHWPGAVGTAVAMMVTPIKAALVLLYFMHLKWEPPVFKIMFLAAVALMAVFMGLSFFDYLYR
ncbi:MAG: cytochrome C oxidase subunit IV family protein [bacterium]|nr:cytochrome C oxidase subunit IV family protein [bacterium]